MSLTDCRENCVVDIAYGLMQAIGGIKPHIQEQQATQRSNSDRMEALQAEVNKLSKQAMDAERRYIPSCTCCFTISVEC